METLTPPAGSAPGMVSAPFQVDGRRAFRADIAPDSIKAEGDGSLTVRMVLASTRPVRNVGWFQNGPEEFEEVLDFSPGAHRGERLNSGRSPILDNHRAWGGVSSVLGVISDPAWDLTRGLMSVAGRVSSRKELEGLRQDIRDRIVTNVSIGFRVHQYRDVTEKGATIRRLLAIDWETLEASFVAVGADPTASTRGDGAPDSRHPVTLWTTPTSERANTMEPTADPAQTTATTAPVQPTAVAPAAPATRSSQPAPIAPPVDQVGQELDRQRGIRAKLKTAGVPTDGELGSRLLDDRTMTVERAGSELLDHVTRRDVAAPPITGEHPVVSGESDEEKCVRALEDVLTHRTMRVVLTDQERKDLDVRLQGNPYVHRRLLDMGERYLERVHGTRGLDRLNIRERSDAVLFTRRNPATSQRGAPAYHVTSDFASVLANVANKGLQRQFVLVKDTYSQWTVPGTLPDFKAAKRVALSDAPRLVRKPEGGEITFGAISDKGETVQLLTYARGLLLSREAVINDDLSAFSKFPRAFGGSSKQLVADLVYSVLTANAALADGFLLFDATNHLNYVTGVGNSLKTAGIDSLSNVRALGRRQKTINPGNTEAPFFMSVDVVHLRVPENLETAAQQLVASVQPTQASNVNPFQGSYESVMAEPRLGAVSQIAYYGMGSPSMVDTIEVDYLDGESGPVIESRLSWLSDGVEMKCRLDVGVAATEYRGVYKNDGTT